MTASGNPNEVEIKRPSGCSFKDFLIVGGKMPHQLLPAEEMLLEAARTGEECQIQAARPFVGCHYVKIRGEFIRFLLLGGDKYAPVHEEGVKVTGAYIEGDLNLRDCAVVRPLHLNKCTVSNEIILVDAKTKTLNLEGSHFLGIVADRVRVEGDIILCKCIVNNGEARFLGAIIDGEVDCGGGKFSNPNCCALSLDYARVTGNVLLDNQFKARGAVRLMGARIGAEVICSNGIFENIETNPNHEFALCMDGAAIFGHVRLDSGFRSYGLVSLLGVEIGGSLNCSDGKFQNEEVRGGGCALCFDRAKILGNASLCGGFEALGEVAFRAARIGEDLECNGGSFSNIAELKRDDQETRNEKPVCCYALNAERATIGGTLWFGPAESKRNKRSNKKHVTINGSLNLRAAKTAVLMDHEGSWPVEHVKTNSKKKLHCYIYPDGFIYERFTADSSFGVEDRKDWLRRQEPRDLKERFAPQPFEQLIRVYRETGHTAAARDIAIFKEQVRLRRPFRGLPWWCSCKNWSNRSKSKLELDWEVKPSSSYSEIRKNRPLQGKHWAINPFKFLIWLFAELGTGYGYRVHRPIIAAIGVWIAAWVVFTEAAHQGVMAPADPKVFLASQVDDCRGDAATMNWVTCQNSFMQAEHTPFYALVYAADVLLPIVPLGQEDAWAPMLKPFTLDLFDYKLVEFGKWFAISFMWFVTIFGWVIGLALVAIVGAAFKRD